MEEKKEAKKTEPVITLLHPTKLFSQHCLVTCDGVVEYDGDCRVYARQKYDALVRTGAHPKYELTTTPLYGSSAEAYDERWEAMLEKIPSKVAALYQKNVTTDVGVSMEEMLAVKELYPQYFTVQ